MTELAVQIEHGAAVTLAVEHGAAVTLAVEHEAQMVVTAAVETVILGGSGTAFYPTPDNIDDTSSGIYFYFGWADLKNTWLIRRQRRIDSTFGDVDSGFTQLQLAWPNRATLDYS